MTKSIEIIVKNLEKTISFFEPIFACYGIASGKVGSIEAPSAFTANDGVTDVTFVQVGEDDTIDRVVEPICLLTNVMIGGGDKYKDENISIGIGGHILDSTNGNASVYRNEGQLIFNDLDGNPFKIINKQQTNGS